MVPEGSLHAAPAPTTGFFYRAPVPGEEPRVGVGDTAEAVRESAPTRKMGLVRLVPDLSADYPVARVAESYHLAEEAGPALLRPRPDEA